MGGTMMKRLFPDRKSTRLNSSHTEIYTLSLHDALPIYALRHAGHFIGVSLRPPSRVQKIASDGWDDDETPFSRSEEHTSELQSHRDLHSFPTRRSSDLCASPCRPLHRRKPASAQQGSKNCQRWVGR